MEAAKILIIAESTILTNSLRGLLDDDGHSVSVATPGPDAEVAISHIEHDLVIIETRDGSYRGIELLSTCKSLQPQGEVIIIAFSGSIEEAVTAMRLGAFDYISGQQKLEVIRDHVLQGLEKRSMNLEVQSLHEDKPASRKIIGKGPKMLEVKRNIARVAPLDCTVIIRGETGTGKELVSRTIHSMSQRSKQKFLAINCGALNEDLLRNEFFGHEREAFTGAVKGKKGLFEEVSGGTLLLDEIGDMPLAMQSQLLRVLQEKTVTRIGGTKEIQVDVRVLAATNRSLRDEIAQGIFREDLFYRLNTFMIRIPPLRDRPDDIPLFCHHFISRYAAEFEKPVATVSDEVMQLFMQHPFPGNVRELENVIERAIILAEGNLIEMSHLPRRFLREMDEHPSPLRTLAELEKQHILEVLASFGGNKSETARALGISRVSLWRRLKEYGAVGTEMVSS
jgi:DNA-binding NtrC family response regulator